MLVSQVLAAKGDAVFTIPPNATLEAAASLLFSRGVGSLVVLEEGRVVGILSERDVVRAAATEGAGALAREVRAFMTGDVVYARPSETVDDLLSRMTDRRIRHLPVCVEGRIQGLVSIGDLVKSKIAEAEAEAQNLRAYIAS
ncbi:MAG: CBS domain-containing protein [Alphaproteobacteria bacterium]|nr:CBS domain-containing protein [Alphaproteobacteria bacterium]